MNDVRKSLIAAGASSVATVCMLIVFAGAATKETKSIIAMVILLIAILVLTLSAIVQWVRYIRMYVEFAIQQKLGQHDKEGKD
jgi:lysylphosphatidylglycerol synthetase-like protein (DUF2156 family)